MPSTTTAPLGNFAAAWPALSRLELVAEPVAVALRLLASQAGAHQILLVDTDPDLADTAAFCAAYDVAPTASANCVVVAARRGEVTTLAACLVLASTRLDVNTAVRKRLEARKASFAAMDVAVAETKMEYGGITPIGVPTHWPILLDAAVVAADHVVIGSGRRRGKLIVPGAFLTTLQGAEVVEGLAR